MGCGWGVGLLFKPANATRQPSAPSFVVRGLVSALVATSVLVVVVFVGRLAWYGHDNTIGVPGLSFASVFLNLMTLLTIRVASNLRNASAGAVLRQVGAGSVAAVVLALGVFIGAVAVGSLLLGATRLAEAWNV